MVVIKNSLVSVVLLGVLICSLLFCVVMFVYRAEQENTRRGYQWLHEGAAYQSQALKNRIADLHATLDAVGRILAFPSKTRQELLTTLNAVRVACDFDFVVLIDAQGKGVNHQGRDNIDLSRRDYFHEASTGKQAVSHITSGAVDTTNAFIGLAVPIMHDGHLVGVMYGSYRVEHFIDLLRAQYHVETSFTQLVNSQGDIIISSRTIDESHPLRGLIRTYLAPSPARTGPPDTASTFSFSYNGHPYYVTCTPQRFGTNDWFIVNVVGSEAMRAKDTSIRQYALALLVQMVAICALLAFLLVRRERLQRELILARQEAEQANRAKSDFLARMSHEMHTPMNAIVGMTRMAMKSLPDAGLIKSYLSKIDSASGILLRLIDDVLTLSSLEKDKIAFESKPFDFKSLLHSWASLYYDLAREKGVHFNSVLYGPRVERLTGDSYRLNRIISCLLSNAIKFTEEGGAVTLTTTCEQHSNAVHMIFTVADTGCGIAPEVLEKLFVPFEHGHGLTSPTDDSTGLGLAITKRVAEGMGGDITVASTPGHGTIFTVSLPFIEATASHPPTPLPEFMGTTVLVYSTDIQSCAAVDSCVDTLHMQNVCVQSHAELVRALNTARLKGYAFVATLVDCVPDPLSRLDNLRDILAEYKAELGTVVLSVYDVVEVQQKATAMGIRHVMSKPLFVSCLYAVLLDMLGQNTPSPKPQQTSPRLLLAEDNELNTEIAVELLQSMGFVVDCAVDGRQALNQLLAAPAGTYTAVLTDIQMPVMDGYALARAIRTSTREDIAALPIIAISANALPEDVARSLESGMQAHVAKPIDVELLAQTLKDNLNPQGENARQPVDSTVTGFPIF